MAALRLAARKIAGGGGRRASMNIGGGSPVVAAEAEGQRRRLLQGLIYGGGGGGSPVSSSSSSYGTTFRRLMSSDAAADHPPSTPKHSWRCLVEPHPNALEKAEVEALKLEVKQKKEELFYKLATLNWQYKKRSKEAQIDAELLCKFIGHVKPNPDDLLWCKYYYARKLNIFLLCVLSTFAAVELVAFYKYTVGRIDRTLET
ncbi:hypothetical protein OsI_05541 [Oryza sativa Indica Group]|uniref:Uncharacterized protein n=2 Tax=Oryza TaxID=4527 RepID=A0A0E0G003_ORYNI|nr:hypothetical protein OsI_05541 [Oryza sativa Indica Group]